MTLRVVRTAFGVACLSLLVSLPGFAAPQSWNYFVVGNPADVVTPTSGLLVLQGGGTDVDENFVRMGQRSGGGDFVVIRAFGTDAYNPYIFDLCHCDSVATIVFKNRNNSFDPFVIDTIRNAEALFIAGGDQSYYVDFWKGTPVEDAIHHVAAKPAPIGGTSAGMAVMSEFVYGALSASSLTSAEGLANPFHRDLTLVRDFLHLPKLGGIITDQHLQERDRMGRTIAFLARLVNDGWTTEGRAIAADRETSLHLDPANGTAEVLATPTHPTPFVYFLRTPGPPEVCQPKTPLTYRNIAVYRIGPGDSFDVDTWSGHGGISYTLTAEAGALSSSRGDIY
ncbi:MAG TPA: cyanophycinase [Candidatus Polarisedimenticolia bacterium]|nr:cyanophycinase [Candidatus Polarisedimenticolia bacterium]